MAPYVNSSQTTLRTDVRVGRPGGGDGGEGAAGEDAVGRQEVDPLGPLTLKHVQGEPEKREQIATKMHPILKISIASPENWIKPRPHRQRSLTGSGFATKGE